MPLTILSKTPKRFFNLIRTKTLAASRTSLFYTTLGISILVLNSCQQRQYSGNAFYRKNPIHDCRDKVPVDVKKDKIELNRFISPDRSISLLTPIVVFKARQRNEQDSSYLATTTAIIRDSVELQFLKSDWIDRVLPKSYDLEGSDADSLKSMMLRYKSDTVDYSNWDASSSFLTNNANYSLLLVLDGIIGFDGARVRERYFWKPEEVGPFRVSELTGNHLLFFLIDNETGKVTYADHYVFHCDIRNHDSLKKVLEYAYLELLEVRFPKS